MLVSARNCAAILLVAIGPACVAPASPPAARPSQPQVAKPAATLPAPQRPTPQRPATRPAALPVAQPARGTPPEALSSTIRELWRTFEGRVGIAIIRADMRWTIDLRGDDLFPQQSVSKLWVALAVFDAIDQGKLDLDDSVTIRRSDLTVFHQPIANLVGPDGHVTTVRELLKLSMTRSDNTANDVLMRRVGGPEGIRAMIARKKLGMIRFGPGERLLQAKTAGLDWRPEYSIGRSFQAARAKLPMAVRQAAMERYLDDPIDGAAPLDIASALLRLKRGELLSRSSTRQLLTLMETSETGKARLRGGLPPGWTLAHKTGTGQDLNGLNAGFNDVGLMTAPDGTTYAIVVMIANTRQPVQARQKLMQSVAAAVTAHHGT